MFGKLFFRSGMFKYIIIVFCLIIGSAAAKAQTTGDTDKDEFIEAFNKFVKTQRYVEVPAEFKGGTANLYDYIQSHIVYPDEARKDDLSAQVFVSFVIDYKTGMPKQVKIVQSSNKIFNSEAIRLIKNMPAWNVATKGGYPQGMLISIPIYFHLK